MYCEQCGNQLNDGDLFCRKCGRAVVQNTNNNTASINTATPPNNQNRPVYVQNTYVMQYQRTPITKEEYLESNLCSSKAKSLQRYAFILELMIISVSSLFTGFVVATVSKAMDAYTQNSDKLLKTGTKLLLWYSLGWLGQLILGRKVNKTKSISASIVYIFVVFFVTLAGIAECVPFLLRTYQGLGATISIIAYIVLVLAPITILGINIALTVEYYRNTYPG